MSQVNNRHRLTGAGFLRAFLRRRSSWLFFTFCVYVTVFFVSYLTAFLLRFDFSLDSVQTKMFFQTVGMVLLIKVAVFYIQKHFRNRWFYASVKDLIMIIESSLICLLFFSFTNLFYRELHLPFVPRSILMIDFLLTILVLGGVRLYWRFIKENFFNLADIEHLKKALLIGANSQGGQIAGLINTRKDTGYYIVGFLTLHAYKVKMQIGYIPIVGQVENLAALALKHKVRDILIIAGLLPGSKFRELYQLCHDNHLTLHVIPQQEILTSTKIPIQEIGINDLLKRAPIQLDTQAINQTVRGKRIMVTGAGGSIGSEICRQLLRFDPEELILLGRGENRIFFLERELRSLARETKIRPVIADVANFWRMEEVFKNCRPEVIFHAAAHKHVPLMENNVAEAVLNNVYGTRVVADAAVRHRAERFVLISTDKAVNPTSVMGTTKHIAERYIYSLAETGGVKFIVTRFGNVLGSSGSVVPIFRQQIEQGGPITITDRRMTRFFMTIPEAAQLVLEAAAMGKGGEIFVLDMGKPVRIVELAEDMIRLAGLSSESIEIQEVGLRPGEKLYEELYFDSEQQLPTGHPKLFAALHRPFRPEEVRRQIDSLLDLLAQSDNEGIKKKFKEIVPEYRPNQPIQNRSDQSSDKASKNVDSFANGVSSSTT